MSDINVTVQDEIVNIDVIDTPVLVEVTNSPGPAGAGVAAGGTTGQVLAKASNTNYDTVWVNPSTGGVPYSGATGNVNLGEYELKAGQVTLDTSPTGTAAVGTIRWNDTTGTSETTLKGGNVILKNGVDLVARVVNKVSPNTTLTKAAYQAVRVSGAQGQRLAIELAQANNDAGSADTIGLVTETIATNQEGFIMTVGQLEGINTTGSLQGETWADGDVLYLSPTTAGALTNIKPTAVTGHIVVIGYVEYAHANNGKIYVKVMNGWELDELHNVSIVSPANNQGLFYNSTSLLWENKSITTALGFTPVPTTRNITINGVTYDLSADRTWTIAAGISGSGASGQVTYWTGASAVSGSNNLFWDNANGRLGIGTNAPAAVLDIRTNIVPTTSNSSIRVQASTTSSVTTLATAFRSELGTDAATFTLGTLIQFYARQGTKGSGSTITNQYGFYAEDNLTGANNNYGFYGAIASSTGRWNLYMGGTADNYLAGNLGIGITPTVRLHVSGDTILRGSGATSATTALTVQNSSSTNLFTVRNDGNVGIGVASSSYPLDVNNTGTSATFNVTARFLQLSTQNGTGAFVSGSGLSYRPQGNQSAQVLTWGINTGQNIGGSYLASNGNTNIAGWFSATVDKNSAANIGIASFAVNNGTSPTQVAGYFALAEYGTSLPTFTNAAIVADNGATTSPIFIGRDNGSTVFTIADGGNVGIGNTPTAAIDIKASTTSAAAMRFRSGTAPTTPNDGDIWFDGTDIKMRIGGVTKTFTLV